MWMTLLVLLPYVISSKPNLGNLISWVSTYELAEQCVETNFYGVERVSEALVPLLQLSNSPRIINISSRSGLLKNISNEWARTMFSDIENLTREKIDEVLKEFQKDFRGVIVGQRLANFCFCLYNVKSSFECLHKDYGQEIPSFPNKLCVPWLCQD